MLTLDVRNQFEKIDLRKAVTAVLDDTKEKRCGEKASGPEK